jgi:hypothetical protein
VRGGGKDFGPDIPRLAAFATQPIDPVAAALERRKRFQGVKV